MLDFDPVEVASNPYFETPKDKPKEEDSYRSKNNMDQNISGF